MTVNYNIHHIDNSVKLRTHDSKHTATCGKCFKFIRSNQCSQTCSNCDLDFHLSCSEVSTACNNSSNSWWCNACFTRACLNELPFGDSYVDLDCFVGKGLVFAHLNIRSLRNKLDHVKMFVNHNDIDIFCITETWLNDDFDDDYIYIDGYNVFRLDRKHQDHGGIVCYVKNSISCKSTNRFDDELVEAMWIEINLPQTKPILLGTVYRAPDSKADYLSRLDNVFQECSNQYDDVVILGDFNVDINKSSNSKKINTIARHSNLSQLIKDFTRITETTKTIIDLAFVSNPDRISSSGVHSLGLSDHSLIYIVRKNKKLKVPPKSIKYRSFKNLDKQDFINSIKKQNWDPIFKCNNVDEALDIWQ